MKNQLLFISLIIAMLSQVNGVAQEIQNDTLQVKELSEWGMKIQKEIDKLKEKKAIYESNQRTSLAQEILEINERVNKLENYTEAMADKDKMVVAQAYAQRIRKHNEMIDAQIDFYKVKTYSDGEHDSIGFQIKNDGGFELKLGRDGRESRKQITTSSFFTLAFGYNYMTGDDLGINDFSYANNNYFAMGIMWQTALTKNHKLRLNYGIQYQTHGTELNGDRIFSPRTDQTEITSLGFQPNKAKFRQDQFVVPLQLEFGGTEKKEYEDGRVRYHQWDKFKFGIGGFAGFNTSSRLKTKFDEGGKEVKETVANAFDNETFIYGVDAYVGIDSYTLFARMNLNDVFKSGSADAQYITFGIRLQ